MTQEEVDLIFKDLFARIPYGVIVKQGGYVGEIRSYDKYTISFNSSSAMPKPFLRPMSSMTEEEEEEFVLFTDTMFRYGKDNNLCVLPLDAIHWLLKNHFDFMGLIPKGLAIEVTKENNPYET